MIKAVANETITNPNLEGLWATDCNRGYKKKQLIKNQITTTTEYFYADKFCKTQSFEFTTIGPVQFDLNNPTWINFTYSDVWLSLFNQDIVDDFNARSVCGFNFWSTQTSYRITGLMCALYNINKPTQIAKSGDQKFGIYKIENDILYYGKLTQANDGSSPENRPVEYSPDTFKKVPGTINLF